MRREAILTAVLRVVNMPHEPAGSTALLEIGLEDEAVDAVIVRYPDLFSNEAVQRSKERIEKWKNA